MLGALATFIYRRRWWTLAASTIFLAASLAMVLRGGKLTGGSFGDNEAEIAQRLVEPVIGHSTATTFIAIFHSDALDPREEPFRTAMKAALASLTSDPDVLSVLTLDNAPPALDLVNGQAKSAIALISLKGEFKEALAHYPAVREHLHSTELAITCTGQVPFMDNFDRVLRHDLVRAEMVSLPLALLVLLLVFRTVVAAALPVGVGALAVVGGIAVVLGLSHVIDIAEYTINVCSLIGLGVAIDYSLFTLSRYREELAAGHDYPDALARALEGAGRVVCFSGLAVATGLGGLMFFKGSFLWAMGVGGTVVVALAIVFALTFLPALLAVLRAQDPRVASADFALRAERRVLAPRGELGDAPARRDPLADARLAHRDGSALPQARVDGRGRARPRPRCRGTQGLRDPQARFPRRGRQPRRHGGPLSDLARPDERPRRCTFRSVPAHRGDSPRHQGGEHREWRGDGQRGLPDRPARPQLHLQSPDRRRQEDDRRRPRRRPLRPARQPARDPGLARRHPRAPERPRRPRRDAVGRRADRLATWTTTAFVRERTPRAIGFG